MVLCCPTCGSTKNRARAKVGKRRRYMRCKNGHNWKIVTDDGAHRAMVIGGF